MATLSVGPGQAYSTISTAAVASRPGDIITVHPGNYVNDWISVTHDLTIQGIPDATGRLPHVLATIPPPNGIGLIDQTGGALILRNLEISGAYLPAGSGGKSNAAGVRSRAGTSLTVDGCYIHDNGNGVLVTANASAIVTITHTELANNGIGDGYTHNVYIGAVKSLTFDQSYSHDVKQGDNIKSRAESTVITNSRIQDQAGSATYTIDLPNGGRVLIQKNVIEQGANSANPIIISNGEEGNLHGGSSLVISDNTILNDLTTQKPLAVRNAFSTVNAEVTHNQVYGLTPSQLLSGAGTVSDTTFLAREPALDSSVPWLPSLVAPSPSPIVTLDQSTGQTLVATPTPYHGPIARLQNQYVNTMTDNLTISVSSDNWFIHSGSGQDAIQVHGGTNVIDGGTGSNFLAGGTGTDTFFIDDRSATADIWSTLVNFHDGDACTIWGIDQSFILDWQDNQGAVGFTGLTLHMSKVGQSLASMTLSGYSKTDLDSGRITTQFGSDPNSGSVYFYVYCAH